MNAAVIAGVTKLEHVGCTTGRSEAIDPRTERRLQRRSYRIMPVLAQDQLSAISKRCQPIAAARPGLARFGESR